MIKGGLALELRLQDVRTTRDIGLRVEGAAPDPLDLRPAGQLDLGDRFTFDVPPSPDHPRIAVPGVRYEGTRYRVKPRFARKNYGRAFGLDVAVGGVQTGQVDSVHGDGYSARGVGDVLRGDRGRGRAALADPGLRLRRRGRIRRRRPPRRGGLGP